MSFGGIEDGLDALADNREIAVAAGLVTPVGPHEGDAQVGQADPRRQRGPTISLYYNDPDGFRVERQIDNLPTGMVQEFVDAASATQAHSSTNR